MMVCATTFSQTTTQGESVKFCSDPPAIRSDSESLTFLDLQAGQTVVAAVPHSDASAYAYMVNDGLVYLTP